MPSAMIIFMNILCGQKTIKNEHMKWYFLALIFLPSLKPGWFMKL